MLHGLDAAAAGMAAQQAHMDALSNDIANVNTTGYKHGRTSFRDLLPSAVGRGGAQGVTAGAGSAATSIGRSFAQGALRQTGRPLDVALQGDGFLQVRTPTGVALTRDGALNVDPRGRLVTNTGALVQPAITVPAGTDPATLSVAADGTVSAGARAIGRLAIVNVTAPQALTSAGDNLFTTNAASGPARAAGAATTVVQGALEGSNVDLGDAMVGMIEAQRGFQLASQAVKMQDQMLQIANGVKS
jgi:flagellar basal-body rod protein FlgG